MKNTLLGRFASIPTSIDPSILTNIGRAEQRRKIADLNSDSIFGYDLWRCYELYWCDSQGYPQVGILELVFDAQSSHIIESKSLKLYLASFYDKRFKTTQELRAKIEGDFEKTFELQLRSRLLLPDQFSTIAPLAPQGLDLSLGLQGISSENKRQSYFLHSFRSLCPVTSQPDFATVTINIAKALEQADLRTTIDKLNSHQGFHEECCERLFVFLQSEYPDAEFMLHFAFTRRGGIEINPVRASAPKLLPNPFELPRYYRQ